MCGSVWNASGKLLRVGGAAAPRRKRAIATLSGMVGALTLARAVDDRALAKEILAAARQCFWHRGSHHGSAPGGTDGGPSPT